MNEDNEICYFYQPGKLSKCSILDSECTGTRSPKVCTFRKTEKQFYEAQNRAIKINRAKGNCARCKFKTHKCELIRIGDEIVDT